MEIVHKFQITSRENVQNNGLSLFPELPKTKRQSEKVLYVKNIYIYIYIYIRAMILLMEIVHNVRPSVEKISKTMV
jgi:hypothetical protein